MNQDVVINLVMNAVTLAIKVAMPILLSGLIVGLMVSIFQAITQIQEMTLTFIPKILVTIAVIVIAGPWMLNQITSYTEQLWQGIPAIVAQ
jgi:flagellar biosynthesis protein FliQ